jgi:RNA polymerase sigma factor (sigma-70 family)
MKEQPQVEFPITNNSHFSVGVDEIYSDFEVWQSFKQGNKSAFIFIYETYFDLLFRYGSRISQNDELVKDAIHDVFFDLRQNCNTIGDTSSIKFFLFKCLKSKILKELKGWLGKKEEFDEKLSFEITFSHEQILIESQVNEEKSQRINRAIQELSPRQREAVYYLYFEGMTYKQVSELMELSSTKSARDIVYKSLRLLRESLDYLPLYFILALRILCI